MHRGHGQGQFAQRQFALHAGRPHKVARQHGEQVGAGHHAPGGEELVDRQHHPPLQRARRQRLVHEAEGSARKAHQQVAGGAVAVQIQHPLGQRMTAPHDHHVFAVVQALVQKARAVLLQVHGRQLGDHAGKVANGQFGRARLQQVTRVARGQGQHAQVHPRCLVLQDVHQPRDDHRGRRVGHGDDKGVARAGRLEAAGRERFAQLSQRVAYRGPQGQGRRRGLHAVTGTAHQFVTQRLAQAPQGVAHRRLRHRQVVRGAREVAFGHHLVKDAQQVQVQGAEVPFIHLNGECNSS